MPQQKIDIQRTLMRFIDDDRIVFPHQRIAVHLREKHAISQKLNRGIARRVIVEADLRPHLASPRNPQLLGHTFGNR